MEQKALRKLDVIVLYSSGHIGSAVVLNKLLQSPDVNIVGIIRSPPLPSGKKSLHHQLKHTGLMFAWLLLWQRCAQALYFFLSILLHPWLKTETCLPCWYISWRYGIPVLRTEKINTADCHRFVNKYTPDIVVSAYYNRILKSEIIRIPKKGVLNIHPGWLPAYRGAMNYFWVLKNNEPYAGVTVHWINEGIDTGDILNQRSYRIKSTTTQHQALIKSAVIGALLLIATLRKLRYGQPLQALKQTQTHEGNYYPMPRKDDFDSYFHSRRFFRLRDVFYPALKSLRKGLSK